jgi:nitroreductase
MSKPAPVDHPVHPLVAGRWSPRSFADKPIEPQKIKSLFEAARWAPSSYNEQPWSFIVATRDDAENFQKVLSTFVEFNQNWAKGAWLIGVALGKRKFERGNKPNRHNLHDVGMSLENLALQAEADGLTTHFMAGFDLDRVRRTFNVPDDHEPATAFAVGYEGDPEQLGDDLKKQETAPRQRRPITDFVFTGSFGHASPLVK